MLSIAAGIIFFILLFIGVGLILPFRLLRESRLVEDLLGAFWMGLALTVGFLQIWHLMSPVGTISFIILGLISLVGWAINWSGLLSKLHCISLGGWLTLMVITILPLLVFSNQVLWGQVHFDHGLYHMQTVKWIESFAIVPGLGNLHHRFGFNNSSFLLVAQINVGIFKGLAYYITWPLLCFPVALRGLYVLYQLPRKVHPIVLSDVYQIFLLPCTLFFVVNSYFAGYSPDIFIFALQAFLGGELIESFSETEISKIDLPQLLTRIVMISAMSVTVKLSSLVFAAGIMLAVLGIFFLRRKELAVKTLPFISRLVGLVAALVVPWLVRSVILTGYLVYPSSLISFDVLWKIPQNMVTPIAPIIRQWALYRSNITPEESWMVWLRKWSGHIPFEVKAGGLAITALLVLMLGLRLWKQKQKLEWKGPVVAFGISCAALLYWFLAAPDFRFLGAVFWLLVLNTLLIFYQQMLGFFYKLSPKLLVGLMVIGIIVWLRPAFIPEINLNSLLIPPSEYEIAAMQVSEGEPPSQITRSGLVVYMANDLGHEACWNEPLPCTRVSDFDPRLELIDPEDMQKGFKVQP